MLFSHPEIGSPENYFVASLLDLIAFSFRFAPFGGSNRAWNAARPRPISPAEKPRLSAMLLASAASRGF